MDPRKQEQYLQMAADNPGLLCSEIPIELLEASAEDTVEPSKFYVDFLITGHTRWLLQKFGDVPRSESQIWDTMVLLWLKAYRLYTSHVLGREDPEWNKPFFSDEGLYD
jgi:hypothetical protein